MPGYDQGNDGVNNPDQNLNNQFSSSVENSREIATRKLAMLGSGWLPFSEVRVPEHASFVPYVPVDPENPSNNHRPYIPGDPWNYEHLPLDMSFSTRLKIPMDSTPEYEMKRQAYFAWEDQVHARTGIPYFHHDSSWQHEAIKEDPDSVGAKHALGAVAKNTTAAEPIPVSDQHITITRISPDTGGVGFTNDHITNAVKINLFGTLSEKLAAGDQLEISADGGKSWAQVTKIHVDGNNNTVTWEYDTVPTNKDGDITYSLRVVDTQGHLKATAETTVTYDFTAPDLVTLSATGIEDTAVAITLQATDAHQVFSFTLTALPLHGKVYSDVNLKNEITVAGGSYSAIDGKLILYFKPDSNWSGDDQLSYTATDNVGNETTIHNASIHLESQLDTIPTKVTAIGIEDNPIPLNINFTNTNEYETIQKIVLKNFPEGSSFTTINAAGETVSLSLTKGALELTQEQLAGLKILPPLNYNGSFELNIETTIHDSTSIFVVPYSSIVTVIPAADAPFVDVDFTQAGMQSIVTINDSDKKAIALNISTTAFDSSDHIIGVAITGVPSDAVLKQGNNILTVAANGSYQLNPVDLSGLTITFAPNTQGATTLTVIATAQANDNPVSTATKEATITLNITDTTPPEYEIKVLSITDDTGSSHTDFLTKDTAVTLHGTLDKLLEVGDRLEIFLNNNWQAIDVNADKSWSVDLPTVTADGDVTYKLRVVDSHQNSSTEVQQAVTYDTKPPEEINAFFWTKEDTKTSFYIEATDKNGVSSFTIEKLPEYGTVYLDENLQHVLEKGETYDATNNKLQLYYVPPANWDSYGVTNTIGFTIQDNAGNVSYYYSKYINVSGVADSVALITPEEINATEGKAFHLNITATSPDTDGSEEVFVIIQGVPEGSTLSAGTYETEGYYSVSSKDLEGLTLTLPPHYNGTFKLKVDATSYEAHYQDSEDGSKQTDQQEVLVKVAPVINTEISIDNITTNEDTAVALPITIDNKGATNEQVQSITISGFAPGTTFSNSQGDTLKPTGTTLTLTNVSQAAGLTMTPPSNYSGTSTLTIKTTVLDNGFSDTLSNVIKLVVNPVADDVVISLVDNGQSVTLSQGSTTVLSPVTGQTVPLKLQLNLTDTDGSETIKSVSLSGLTQGTVVKQTVDGVVVSKTADASGIVSISANSTALATTTITLPNNLKSANVTVNVTSQDQADNTVVSKTSSSTVHINLFQDISSDAYRNPFIGNQDNNTINAAKINYNLGSAIIQAAGLTDLSGDTQISLSIINMPNTALMNKAYSSVIPVDNGNGTYTINIKGTVAQLMQSDQLPDLKLILKEGFSPFNISVYNQAQPLATIQFNAYGPNDLIVGNLGADTLMGGKGDDVIIGDNGSSGATRQTFGNLDTSGWSLKQNTAITTMPSGNKTLSVNCDNTSTERFNYTVNVSPNDTKIVITFQMWRKMGDFMGDVKTYINNTDLRFTPQGDFPDRYNTPSNPAIYVAGGTISTNGIESTYVGLKNSSLNFTDANGQQWQAISYTMTLNDPALWTSGVLKVGFGAASYFDNGSVLMDNIKVASATTTYFTENFENVTQSNLPIATDAYTNATGQADKMLGHFSYQDSNPSLAVSKTYDVIPQVTELTLNFDFIAIDSGATDTSKLTLYLDGQAVVVSLSGIGGTFSGGSYTVATLPNVSAGTTAVDKAYHLSFTLTNTALWQDGKLTVGFGAGLDQASSAKSWGIDNTELYATGINGTAIPPQYIQSTSAVEGNDILVGGAGNDLLIGGGGGDKFVLNLATDAGTAGNPTVDTIQGFTVGTDAGVMTNFVLNGTYVDTYGLIESVAKDQVNTLLAKYFQATFTGGNTVISVAQSANGPVIQKFVIQGVDLTKSSTGAQENISTIVNKFINNLAPPIAIPVNTTVYEDSREIPAQYKTSPTDDRQAYIVNMSAQTSATGPGVKYFLISYPDAQGNITQDPHQYTATYNATTDRWEASFQIFINADWSGKYNNISYVAVAQGGSVSASAPVNLTILPVSDNVEISLIQNGNATIIGPEGISINQGYNKEISLNLRAALTDTDGSEKIDNITLSGLPEGTKVTQVVNGISTIQTVGSNGTVTLNKADLSNIKLDVPVDAKSFVVAVNVTNTDTAGSDMVDTRTHTSEITVNISSVIQTFDNFDSTGWVWDKGIIPAIGTAAAPSSFNQIGPSAGWYSSTAQPIEQINNVIQIPKTELHGVTVNALFIPKLEDGIFNRNDANLDIYLNHQRITSANLAEVAPTNTSGSTYLYLSGTFITNGITNTIEVYKYNLSGSNEADNLLTDVNGDKSRALVYKLTINDPSFWNDGDMSLGFGRTDVVSGDTSEFALKGLIVRSVDATGAFHSEGTDPAQYYFDNFDRLDRQATTDTAQLEINRWMPNTAYHSATDPADQMLGRFEYQRISDQTIGAQAISKTFDVNKQVTELALKFDFLALDVGSQDPSKLSIYFEGSSPIVISLNGANSTGTFAYGSYQVQAEANANLGFNAIQDNLYHVTVTINNPSLWNQDGKLNLGFGAYMNQVSGDQTWGLDNVALLASSLNGQPVTLQDAANPTLGGSGNDILIGGAGNDIIEGGAGSDILTGGASADSFVWNLQSQGSVNLSGIDVDTITDFKSGQDSLSINGLNLNGELVDAAHILKSDQTGTLLAQYFKVSTQEGSTHIEISQQGNGVTSQKIVLQGVDLTAGGASTQDIIESLINSNTVAD